MDFDRLLQKREQLAKVWDAIPQVAKEKLERSFDIEYAHNSTAIEGNTLTLIQTKAILDYCEYVIAHGSSIGFTGPMVTFDEFNSIVGLPELRELEEKFKA